MTNSATGLPQAPLLHRLFVPVASVCFIATLVTDITYTLTANILWADMSDWLLSIGVIVFGIITLVGFITLLADHELRQRRLAWLHLAVNLVALVLSFFNALIHTRDAYTSVVPAGLTLSAIVVLLLMATGWTAASVSYRSRSRRLAGAGP